MWQTQIDCLLNPEWKGKHWKDDDIQQALILWSTSKQAYRYLRKNRIIPLPCERFLEKKIEHITLPPGFLENLEDMMMTKADTLQPHEKVVNLSMDEV